MPSKSKAFPKMFVPMIGPVNCTLPLGQKVVDPPSVIIGFNGVGFTVTTFISDAALKHPIALVTFTV